MSEQKRRSKTRSAIVGLGVLALGMIAAVIFYAVFEYTLVAEIREVLVSDDSSNELEYGAMLFKARGCSSCHELSDAQSVADLGPGLDGIGSRLDAREIRESIANPSAQRTLCNNQPCPFDMPEFGEILTGEQIDALVLYLSHQSDVLNQKNK